MAINNRNFYPPSGNYEFIWQWVNKYYQYIDYLDIHPRHQAMLQMPKFLQEDQIRLFQKHLNSLTYGAFVTAIPEGRFCGDIQLGAIISQDNKLIRDVSFSGEADPSLHWIFQRDQLPPVENLDENIAVLYTIPYWHNNYYHWMFDVLAKLDLLAQSKMKIDKYIINPLSLPFQSQTLKQFGISKKRIIENHKDLHIKARKLIIPSQPTMLPEWACQFLRKKLAENINQNEGKNSKIDKVYISRKDANSRRIINEVEVLDILKRKGFSVVTLSELDVFEQIKIFDSAKVIVAAHGAGLTNLLFSKRKTKLIEIFSPAYVHPLYWILSNRIGIDYYYLLGEGPRQDEIIYENWPITGGDEDIVVNIPKFMKILELAGY